MSLQDFKDSLCRQLYGTTVAESPGKCVKCKEAFTDANVFTPAGWKETKISGLCERCFNEEVR